LTDISIATGNPSWLRLARRAKLLATLTLVWLGIEGTVGVVAGILAGSIALVAFGLDSAIEGLASVIVIWRFTGTRTISESAERRAQKWVAVSFFLLAPYVAAEAIETLIEGAAAETSWLGIALTGGTLMLCPWLGRARQQIGEQLGSRSTYGEGTQNMLCSILAAAVLVGLATNTLFGRGGLTRLLRLRSPPPASARGERHGAGRNAGARRAHSPPPRFSYKLLLDHSAHRRW